MQKRGREKCPKSLECKERGRSGRCATVDGLAQSTKLAWFLSGSIVIVGGSLGGIGPKTRVWATECRGGEASSNRTDY